VDDTIEEHASVRQVKLAHQQPVLGTLDECFQLYTQEERVSSQLRLLRLIYTGNKAKLRSMLLDNIHCESRVHKCENASASIK